MPDYPTVYCPKESKQVPPWYCLGSASQKKEKCPELRWASISSARIDVKCTPRDLRVGGEDDRR